MKINYKDDKKRSENFGIIPNKIAYYYKEVFNIEIVGLLYKKNLNRKINKEIKNNNCLEIVGISTFDFFILIKDNNKKIFKYKLLKTTYDNSEFREKENQHAGFFEKIYFFVDRKLCKYCKDKYFDKLDGKEINNIIEKNNKINEDYKRWLIENYG